MFVDIKTPNLVEDKVQNISYFKSLNYLKKNTFFKSYTVLCIFLTLLLVFTIPFIRLQLS